MLDLGTFGNSPAAINLAKIMNERDYPSRKVGRLLESFNRNLNELSKLDKKINIGIGKILYQHYSLKCVDFPTPIDTYTHNVLNTSFKKWILKEKGYLQRNKR